MSKVGRLHDKSRCVHGSSSPAQTSSSDVFVNDVGVLRVGDVGGVCCCSGAPWSAIAGAAHVHVNDRDVHRVGDAHRHCCGAGALAQGSPDVEIGDA